MPTPDYVRQIALSFPETTEQPHFDKTSFRVGKKIFATLNAPQQRATLKLSAQDQDLFTIYDPTIVYAVPNKWGKQGWTQIDLTRVPEEMLTDALAAAYCEVAPAKLADAIRAQRKDSEDEES
ncbi:MmcQ/YjbR family DNA-binding protein [Salmonirosea aquatica]|uniref:MmcQ/YjbR family DNA-binding protein n=1 Tax=Salmonirosea aquatica TaxID=2654236 RepID=A0A7C9FDP2_9BACT|nr:MmcQ/YjbR family DNA-binding protein [Cytophagaceae bacterium SJW1-29]